MGSVMKNIADPLPFDGDEPMPRRLHIVSGQVEPLPDDNTDQALIAQQPAAMEETDIVALLQECEGDEDGLPTAAFDTPFPSLPKPEPEALAEKVRAPVPMSGIGDHGDAIMAVIRDALEAERHHADQDLVAARIRTETLSAEIDDLRRSVEDVRRSASEQVEATRAVAAEQIEAARSDAAEAIGQLTLTLDQVRQLRAQVDSQSKHLSALIGIEEKARSLDAQLAEERTRNAELQERMQVVAEGRTAAEETAAKARAAAELARRELAAGRALHAEPSGVGEIVAEHRVPVVYGGAVSGALFPVQITAVVETQTSAEDRTGLGAVFDIRLATAIPLDTASGPASPHDVVDRVVSLAHSMYPNAVLTIAFGDDGDRRAVQGRYQDVTFTSADVDDRRRKAAQVLAIAAGNLSQ
jgi:hypothetical protein|uniref:Uncharacterized protein n=2 Tax=Magnetospirillum gryphiswaldense TaxID=55518 RepID=Q3BK98_9PROT|nr:hypothetical protein mgI505 [Magnetospirillum gryphiswaldense MSR-1]CAM78038.1 hypothetical protein MGR_4106 [Magnetospirillum gryphiswaldense MSR-1]